MTERPGDIGRRAFFLFHRKSKQPVRLGRIYGDPGILYLYCDQPPKLL